MDQSEDCGAWGVSFVGGSDSSARSPRSGLTRHRANSFGKSAIVFECQLQEPLSQRGCNFLASFDFGLRF
jgi:hypothetical protein